MILDDAPPTILAQNRLSGSDRPSGRKDSSPIVATAPFAATPFAKSSPCDALTDDELTDGASPTDAVSGHAAPDAAPSAATLDDEVLGMTCGDRLALACAAVVCLVALTVQSVRLGGWGAESIEVVRQQPLHAEHRLDANAATWVEWMQLEGIGEVLARRIVEDRETRGSFRSVDDLERVGGIGPKTVEKLRPYVEVRSANPTSTLPMPPR
jgi:competence protein ComEA